MTPALCGRLDEDLDALAAGAVPTPDQQAHLDACPRCRTQLALARRIERVLAGWPTTAPPRHFASTVAAAARRETWRQEQVVDWGFNLALAAGLAAMTIGLAALVWLVGAAAGSVAGPALPSVAVTGWLQAVRAQAPIVATATVLLATALGAWWWAEERGRW